MKIMMIMMWPCLITLPVFLQTCLPVLQECQVIYPFSLFVVHFCYVRQFHQIVQPESHTCKDHQWIYYVTSATCFGLFIHLQGRWFVLVLYSVASARSNLMNMLTHCRWATQKCVIALLCVVDRSRISTFFLHDVLHICLSCGLAHLSLQGYSLMQDAWVSRYK